MTTDRNCLDAETLAAWMDGGLDPAAAAAAEAHASTCERCQALLATVVKTLPAEPVVSGASNATSSLWKWWFAPLAATAAAVTIWMVVPQEPMERPAAPVVADQKVAQGSARDAAAPRREFKEQARDADASATAGERSGELRRDAADAASGREGGRFAPVAPAAPAVAANEQKAESNAVGKLADAAGARADQDSQAAKREQAPQAAEMRQRLEAPAAAAPEERFRAGAAAPTATPAAPAPSAATQLKKQAAPLIVSPDANSQWRASAPGTVERSEDGGRTWSPVRIAVKEEILSGASPARLVCWLVGRSGLVLLATDGTNFTRLPFPESVDLVSVSSPEARIAIVTTADGRTFRTEDGGRNWRNP